MRMSTAFWAQARSRAADWFCRWCLLGALAGSVHAGLLDESFDLKLPPTNYILSVLIQSDGRIIVSGRFTNILEIPRSRIARLNPDGTVDKTFMPFLVGADQRLQCFALSSTGGILVGRGVPDIFTPSVLRLTPTGTRDVSFAFPLELQRTYGSARSITVLPDDKLVVVLGEGCFYTGSPLLCLLPDGSIDPAFSPPRFAPILPLTPEPNYLFIDPTDAVGRQRFYRIRPWQGQ